jgi:hypothetical protein
MSASGGPVPDEQPTAEQSLGQLVSKVTSNVSTLVRLEIELAKAELTDQFRQGAMGGAMVAVAAFLGFVSFFLLSFAAVYGLAEVMPVWAAFLVVAGVYLLVAALLGFVASRRFRALKGPERAIAEANKTRDLLVELNGRASAHASGLSAADRVDIRAEAATTQHAYETPPTPSG